MKSNAGDYGSTGNTQAESFVSKVASKVNDAKSAGTKVSGSAVAGLKSNAGDYGSAGTDEGGRFVSGVAGKEGAARGAGESLSRAGKSGAESSDFYTAGTNLGQGLANGIANMVEAVRGAAAGIANAALGKLKSLMGIESPSKVFTLMGEYCGQGFANGFINEIPTIESAATEMGDASMEAIKAALSDVADFQMYFDDTEPVITPVVDSTNIKAAAEELEAMMNASAGISRVGRRASSLGGRIESVNGVETTETRSAGTVINQTFNQTNNSPKALSELEIYRRSKSLFAMAKGPEAVSK